MSLSLATAAPVRPTGASARIARAETELASLLMMHLLAKPPRPLAARLLISAVQDRSSPVASIVGFIRDLETFNLYDLLIKILSPFSFMRQCTTMSSGKMTFVSRIIRQSRIAEPKYPRTA